MRSMIAVGARESTLGFWMDAGDVAMSQCAGRKLGNWARTWISLSRRNAIYVASTVEHVYEPCTCVYRITFLFSYRTPLSVGASLTRVFLKSFKGPRLTNSGSFCHRMELVKTGWRALIVWIMGGRYDGGKSRIEFLTTLYCEFDFRVWSIRFSIDGTKNAHEPMPKRRTARTDIGANRRSNDINQRCLFQKHGTVVACVRPGWRRTDVKDSRSSFFMDFSAWMRDIN